LEGKQSDKSDKKFLPLIHIPGVSSEVQKVLNKHKTEIHIAPNNIKTIKKFYSNTKLGTSNRELKLERFLVNVKITSKARGNDLLL
jgi:hypothetical protein